MASKVLAGLDEHPDAKEERLCDMTELMGDEAVKSEKTLTLTVNLVIRSDWQAVLHDEHKEFEGKFVER